MKTIVITDQPSQWALIEPHSMIVSAMDYLLDSAFASSESVRLINLCQTYQYQSIGYYVSLLAEARGHKVVPSVLTMRDIKNSTLSTVISASISKDIQHALHSIKSDEFVLSIYFGKNIAKRYDELCRKLHGLFPVPLFRVNFRRKKDVWAIHKISPLSIDEIPQAHHDGLQEAAIDYFAKKRFCTNRKKVHSFFLAMLHDPEELTPPSNKEALEKFVEAGDEVGISVELIQKDDYKTISEYDALFIRETTSVDHHTYNFARRAAADRLVVIDDPVSILKCANKVYLAELLNKNHISTPTTILLGKQNWKAHMQELKFPVVLKLPDSSFSQGVLKVETPEEFDHEVRQAFKASELIIAQPFMPSEFDWRIGVLNNQPLFACRYYMAKDHWQIYNWNSHDEVEGNFDTVPISEVPKVVIDTALKSTKYIGDGLYGVDLKQFDKSVYVIEVNDNPNIDAGVEDVSLGDNLYLEVMKTFLQRMKRIHGYE